MTGRGIGGWTAFTRCQGGRVQLVTAVSSAHSFAPTVAVVQYWIIIGWNIEGDPCGFTFVLHRFTYVWEIDSGTAQLPLWGELLPLLDPGVVDSDQGSWPNTSNVHPVSVTPGNWVLGFGRYKDVWREGTGHDNSFMTSCNSSWLAMLECQTDSKNYNIFLTSF